MMMVPETDAELAALMLARDRLRLFGFLMVEMSGAAAKVEKKVQKKANHDA